MTTLYCYDTEFRENGHTIELISIGIVCEDGREYYAINADADWDRIRKDDWLMENVVAHLPTHSTGQVERRRGFGGGWSWGGINMRDSSVKPKWVIANEVRDFLLARPNGTSGGEWQPHPELWAYYAAYDHVALAQLWGRMIGLPKGIPMWTNDLQQELFRRGVEPPSPPDDEHNALADARWVLKTLNGLRVERGQ